MTDAEILDHLSDTLCSIRNLVAVNRNDWDANAVLRLAVERVWIAAGELPARYAEVSELPAGTNPSSELHRFRSRLAHSIPGEISPARVGEESHADLERILAEVDTHRST